MTYAEYEKTINELLSNPDTALANTGKLLEELKKDTTSLETMQTENEKLNARIKDLQDTNMKLYLSVTGESSGEDDDEPAEGIGVIDEFLKMVESEE